MLNDLRRDQHLAATTAHESRDRHAPHALAGEAPVRPVLDHAVDAVAAPLRNPAHTGVDRIERLLPEIVLLHRDEPLIGRPENHRIFAPPAMRVGVRKGPFPEQEARRLELLHDQRVRLEDGLPSPFRGRVREPTLIVEDRKSTRLNSSHGYISYAVFCLKKKKKNTHINYSTNI